MAPLKPKSGIFAIAMLVCVVVACKQLQSLARPTILKSPDGKFQLTVPAGWQERPALNAQASIKAANLMQETYVMLITENKFDFANDMTLDRFTDITRSAMVKKVAEGDASSSEPVTINGNEGRQYTLEGVVSGVKLSYLVTTVKTASNYHQIIAWTLRSRIDQNRPALLRVTESFRSTSEPKAAPKSSPNSQPE